MLFTSFLPFLSKYWKLIALVGIVAAGYFYVTNLKSTITKQQQQIELVKAENVIIKDNNTKLEASIKASNASIEKLAAGAANTTKQFAQLSSNVKTQTSTLEARLLGVLAEQKPETCEATIEYLIRSIQEYK